jgi:hypothetical protein
MTLRLRRIRRTRDGRFRVRLPRPERDLLRDLPGQLLDLLERHPDDPSLKRLFPPAYLDDPDGEADYRSSVSGELLEHHRKALEVLAETVDATELDEDQLLSWLGALNELRLVLGTRLDVTEDMEPVPPDDPRAPALALYGYLSYLEEQLVETLSGA